MAAGNPVPPTKHVIRYLRKKDVHRGKANLSGFIRPEKDVDGLSFCEMGVLAAEREEDIRLIRGALRSRLELDKKGGLAEMPVAAIMAAGQIMVEKYGVEIAMVQDPLPANEERRWPANPAHALLTGLPPVARGMTSSVAEATSDLLRLTVLDPIHSTEEVS